MLKITKSKSQPRKPAKLISVSDLVDRLAGIDTAALREIEMHLKDAKEVIDKLGPLPHGLAKGFIAAHQIFAERAKCLTQCRDRLAEIVLGDAMARIARDEEKRSSSANANDDCPSPVPTETVGK